MLDFSYASFAALTASCRARGSRAADCASVCSVLAQNSPAALRRNLGVGPRHDGVPYRRAHRAGQIRPVSFVEGSCATRLPREQRRKTRVMIYGDQAFGSSLLFYLQRPIELVEGRTTSMWFGSTFPDAPKIYLTDADLQRDWSGRQSDLPVRARPSEGQGRFSSAATAVIGEEFGKVRLQQPALMPSAKLSDLLCSEA